MFEFCVLEEFVLVCRVFAWRSKWGVNLARRNILEIVSWFVLFVMLARLHSGVGEWVRHRCGKWSFMAMQLAL